MKKIILVLLIYIIAFGNAKSQPNLARTATYYSSNIYYGSIEVPEAIDGNLSSSLSISNETTSKYFVIDLGAEYTVYKFVFKWGTSRPYAIKANNTTDGSGDYLFSVQTEEGTQPIVLSTPTLCRYIRIEFFPYQNNPFSVNLNEMEIYSLIYSVTGSDYDGTHTPEKAVDNNSSTWFQCYIENMSLTLGLSREVKALSAVVNSDTKNLKVSITGPNGTINAYDYVNSSNEFLIINPDGITSINIAYETNATVKLYEVTLQEIPLGTISMPFDYDVAGNMILRTIQYSTTKSAEFTDSVQQDDKKPFVDKFNGKEIYVYPIPTKGILNVDFRNFDSNDNVVIELYSISGQKVLETRTNAGLLDFDLGSRANGTYILNVKVNSETHKWKIIKE